MAANIPEKSPLTKEANELPKPDSLRHMFRGAKVKEIDSYNNPCIFEKSGLFVLVVTYEDRTEILVVNPRHAALAWKGVAAEDLTHEMLLKALHGASGKKVAKLRTLPDGKLALFLGIRHRRDKEFESVSSKIELAPLVGVEAVACSLDVMWHVRAIEVSQRRDSEGASSLQRMLLLQAVLGKQ